MSSHTLGCLASCLRAFPRCVNCFFGQAISAPDSVRFPSSRTGRPSRRTVLPFGRFDDLWLLAVVKLGYGIAAEARDDTADPGLALDPNPEFLRRRTRWP